MNIKMFRWILIKNVVLIPEGLSLLISVPLLFIVGFSWTTLLRLALVYLALTLVLIVLILYLEKPIIEILDAWTWIDTKRQDDKIRKATKTNEKNANS